MERWAANTLRTLGIILTAGFVLLTSAFLLLLAMCAAQGDLGGNKHPEQVVPYITAAVVVMILGVWFIAWLARSIHRSLAFAGAVTQGPLTPPIHPPTHGTPNVPFHLSPLGQRAIYRLVAAIAAQILVSAACWAFTQVRLWSQMNALLSGHPNYLVLLLPYILYHLPYAILLYALLRHSDRRAFTYALAIPAVLILHSLFSRAVISYLYVHQPLGFFLMFLPWSLHIIILVLAYKAIRQIGFEPQPTSLLVAALVIFIYLVIIQAPTPSLYRLRF